MRLMNRLADGAEDFLRHRRRVQIRQFIVGDPLIGGLVGILACGLANLISLLAIPYDVVVTILVLVAMLALTGLATKRMDEPVGDLHNRGMTRVYGWPWIPFQLRNRLSWDWEPWRSAFLVAFVYLALDGIVSTDAGLPMLVDSSIITGVVLGAGVALLKELTSRDSWRNLIG